MKILIDLLLVSFFSLIAFQGARYGFEQVEVLIQKMAIEKASQGLGSLESATQTLTDGKLDF